MRNRQPHLWCHLMSCPGKLPWHDCLERLPAWENQRYSEEVYRNHHRGYVEDHGDEQCRRDFLIVARRGIHCKRPYVYRLLETEARTANATLCIVQPTGIPCLYGQPDRPTRKRKDTVECVVNNRPVTLTRATEKAKPQGEETDYRRVNANES